MRTFLLALLLACGGARAADPNWAVADLDGAARSGAGGGGTRRQ